MHRPLQRSRHGSKTSEKDSAAASPPLRDTPADACSVRLSFQQKRIDVLSGLDPTGYNYHVLEVARLLGRSISTPWRRASR